MADIIHEWKEEWKEKKDDLYKRLTYKLNKLLSDEELTKLLQDYYFEPTTNMIGEIPVYTFTNPINQKSFRFRWDSIHDKPQILDQDLDAETLTEFHTILQHFVEKQKQLEKTRVKQFLDFYEDSEKITIIIEIPDDVDNDEIELRANPAEVEVISGDFHRQIPTNARIIPKSGKAIFHDEEQTLEVTFRKSPLQRKRKRKIHVHKQ